MFLLSMIENSAGECLDLMASKHKYVVQSIIGLNPPVAQINETQIVGMDGAKFNSARLETRNIVIQLFLRGDIEASRQEILNFFRTKQTCRFYFGNQNRSVFIDGRVNTIEYDMFVKPQILQASILCMDPYLKSTAEHIISFNGSQAGFWFPFAINQNDPVPISEYTSGSVANVYCESDVETGLLIRVNALNSFSKFTIMNVDTGKYIVIEYEFEADDQLLINTANQDVSIRLLRDGAYVNLFPALGDGSSILRLEPGNNHFGYMVNTSHSHDSKAEVTFEFRTLYQGV